MKGERNYHAFYHLLKGGSMDMMKDLYLLDDKGQRKTKDFFNYLKEGCDDIPVEIINDVELYNELMEKFGGELGFSSEERIIIWKIVAAVLHIGNLDLDLEAYDVVKSKVNYYFRCTV